MEISTQTKHCTINIAHPRALLHLSFAFFGHFWYSPYVFENFRILVEQQIQSTAKRKLLPFSAARHLQILQVGSDAFTKSVVRLKECFDGKS